MQIATVPAAAESEVLVPEHDNQESRIEPGAQTEVGLAGHTLLGDIDSTDVTIGSLSLPWVRFDPVEHKARGADWLSKALLWAFAGSVAVNLIVPLVLVATMRSVTEATPFLEAYVKLLKETSTFVSTVYGPLLAFVLGYYFSDKKGS